MIKSPGSCSPLLLNCEVNTFPPISSWTYQWHERRVIRPNMRVLVLQGLRLCQVCWGWERICLCGKMKHLLDTQVGKLCSQCWCCARRQQQGYTVRENALLLNHWADVYGLKLLQIFWLSMHQLLGNTGSCHSWLGAPERPYCVPQSLIMHSITTALRQLNVPFHLPPYSVVRLLRCAELFEQNSCNSDKVLLRNTNLAVT